MEAIIIMQLVYPLSSRLRTVLFIIDIIQKGYPAVSTWGITVQSALMTTLILQLSRLLLHQYTPALCKMFIHIIRRGVPTAYNLVL